MDFKLTKQQYTLKKKYHNFLREDLQTEWAVLIHGAVGATREANFNFTTLFEDLRLRVKIINER